MWISCEPTGRATRRSTKCRAAHYRSEQAQVHGVRRLGYRITANICAFGWKARDFALKRVDCKTYSLAATEKATETLSLFLRIVIEWARGTV